MENYTCPFCKKTWATIDGVVGCVAKCSNQERKKEQESALKAQKLTQARNVYLREKAAFDVLFKKLQIQVSTLNAAAMVAKEAGMEDVETVNISSSMKKTEVDSDLKNKNRTFGTGADSDFEKFLRGVLDF